MTLLEMKKDVLKLIEEIDDTEEDLTSDPDIAAKLNTVINLVMMEVARMKKTATFKEIEVASDSIFDMNTIDDFYQLKLIRAKDDAGNDIEHEIIENMVIFKASGTATIFYYKYPPEIKEDTPDTYVFDLTKDALGVIPYGVAGDLLKSDVSTSYGQIYTQKYETMLNRLDPRFSMGTITVEGGVYI